MDGSDSTCAQTGLTRLLEKLNEALREDGITLEHTSMENYAALMRDKLKGEDLQVIKGELRDGPSPLSVGQCADDPLSGKEEKQRGGNASFGSGRTTQRGGRNAGSAFTTAIIWEGPGTICWVPSPTTASTEWCRRRQCGM